MDETLVMAGRLLRYIEQDLLEIDASLGPDADLFAAGLDSMSIMQILLFIEEELGVKLPDAAITRANFCTARRIADAIRKTKS